MIKSKVLLINSNEFFVSLMRKPVKTMQILKFYGNIYNHRNYNNLRTAYINNDKILEDLVC